MKSQVIKPLAASMSQFLAQVVCGVGGKKSLPLVGMARHSPPVLIKDGFGPGSSRPGLQPLEWRLPYLPGNHLAPPSTVALESVLFNARKSAH